MVQWWRPEKKVGLDLTTIEGWNRTASAMLKLFMVSHERDEVKIIKKSESNINSK